MHVIADKAISQLKQHAARLGRMPGGLSMLKCWPMRCWPAACGWSAAAPTISMRVDVSTGIGGKANAPLARQQAGITVNKNMIPYDERANGPVSALAALTTRMEYEIQTVASWICVSVPQDEAIDHGSRSVSELAPAICVPAGRCILTVA